MKTPLLPATAAQPRSFADRLGDIRSLQQSAATATKALLLSRGWRLTRMNPAHLWLWSKKFPDGRTLLTDLSTALAIESALAGESAPPVAPALVQPPLAVAAKEPRPHPASRPRRTAEA